MKLWKSLVLLTLAIALTYYLTTQTDEYQIGKIVMNHAKKFARENATQMAGCKIHLLKDGVAIFFGETIGGEHENKNQFLQSSRHVPNFREVAQNHR
jgi:hypothetical protein